MKYHLALGLIFTAFATNVMANSIQTPTTHEEMPDPMRDQRNMKDRMNDRMDRMWKELDANGDGAITKTESDEFSAKKFSSKDANHDGKITREEWDAFRDNKRAEMHEKMGKHHDDMSMSDKKPETDSKK